MSQEYGNYNAKQKQNVKARQRKWGGGKMGHFYLYRKRS
jgi:hypothetical protein